MSQVKMVAPYELDQLPAYTVIESATGVWHIKGPSGAWHFRNAEGRSTWRWIPELPAILVDSEAASKVFDLARLRGTDDRPTRLRY
jgi:hypothetical protein